MARRGGTPGDVTSYPIGEGANPDATIAASIAASVYVGDQTAIEPVAMRSGFGRPRCVTQMVSLP